MAKRAFLVVFVGLLLAGCTEGPGDDGGGVATPAPTYTVTAGVPQVAKLTTDTYHLLARPDLTTRAPTAQDPIRVPIGSFFQNTAAGGLYAFADSWNTTLMQDVHGFSGNATLVVEVTGTLIGDPRADLQGGGCFWQFGVGVGSYETGSSHDLGCVKQGSTVPAGVYSLTFPFSITDVAWTVGTELHFELHTNEEGPRAPGAAADLLTASVPCDSTIRVHGLEMPVDTSLILATT